MLAASSRSEVSSNRLRGLVGDSTNDASAILRYSFADAACFVFCMTFLLSIVVFSKMVVTRHSGAKRKSERLFSF